MGRSPMSMLAAQLDQEWRLEAACRGMDPELFFHDRGEMTTDAKRACAGCPVREECLEYALVGGEHFGIWGGTSERERRRIRRRRAEERRRVA